MKICITIGTRPEIIKMSSIIRKCERDGLGYFILHTNQHYSENMDKIFFEELELPQPKYNLGIGSGSHGEMTGRMLIEIEKVFNKEKPNIVLVQGDTNTVLAGALVASKMDIKVGHVEAGLRSYDRTMPEEINRVVADHVSDYLFVPTETQKQTVLKEDIDASKVFVTGNTVVDAVMQGLKIAKEKSEILAELNIESDEYILMTAHRPATVDNKRRLQVVLSAVQNIADKYNKTIIFPAHPRTVKMIEKFRIKLSDRYKLIDPVGYLDMLVLQNESFLIITDSGGLQEESCILKKKCVVIRENTERPEAVDVGGCILAGNSNKDTIITKSLMLMEKRVDWYNPFGDGRAGENIVGILSKDLAAT